MSGFRPGTFRLQIVILLVGSFVVVIGLVATWAAPQAKWVTVGSADEVARSGVVFNEDRDVYLVQGAHGPVALSALGPWNNERVTYCPSSELFEAARSGSKFDSRGYYLYGPAPHAMNRYPTRVLYGQVQVQPHRLIEGVSRSTSKDRAEEPAGPYCIAY